MNKTGSSQSEPFALLTRRAVIKAASALTLLGTNVYGWIAKAASPERDPLAAGFIAPPMTSAPWVYWYWISENISKTGISRDLEAMARLGIGEALIGVIQEAAPPGGVRTLSEPWWEMVVHAVREGHRTGVGINLFNSPGWSQSGGPWVTPSRSMRYVTSSELRVQGPQHLFHRFDAALPRDFQGVAILAFPAPRDDDRKVSALGARITATPQLIQPERLLAAGSGGGCVFAPALLIPVSAFDEPEPAEAQALRPHQTIEIVTDQPFTARSIELTTLPVPIRAAVDLEAANNSGRFVLVRRFILDRSNPMKSAGPMSFGPVALSFPAVTSHRFRLIFRGIRGDIGCGLARIQLSGAAKLDHYVEKQLGKMHQTPLPAWDAYVWPLPTEPDLPGLTINPDDILDLSERMDVDGTLQWDVPEGEWIILRSGMIPTGTTNGPASPASTGLEIDKMNAAALETHFDAYVGELLRRLPADEARSALRRVIADSYEAGPQNWTDGFHEAFAARYGYDPRRWLPTLTGRIVDTADQSERFLWDLRRLVADMVADKYVGALRRICERHGLGLWLENYGHWGFPGEFLQYGGQADRIGGEFWIDKAGAFDLGAVETGSASSAAAIYGKSIVSAEAFTGGSAWRGHPSALKRRGDWAFSRGINHFVLHVYIHQPWDDRRPGINAAFGTEFNRHNTWFEHMGSWIDYLRRSSFLLQQGRPAMEIAYFTGEHAPQMTGPMDPRAPFGFATVFVNAEVIETRLTVRNGRFTLPDGGDFAVLVLPPIDTMRPASLRALRALVAAGGTIVGKPPLRSPSLSYYPHADAEIGSLMREMWQGMDGEDGHVTFGKGNVFGRKRLAAALQASGARPSLSEVDSLELLWSHRRMADGDLFFLSNQGDRLLPLYPAFHAPDGDPQVWDAITGRIASLPTFQRTGDTVRLPLVLPPAGSVFVVFRLINAVATGMIRADAGPMVPLLQPIDDRLAGGKLVERVLRSIAGPWDLSFPTLTQKYRRFLQLSSWSDDPDPAVRHFSGTAIYSTQLYLRRTELRKSERLLLDLGAVGVIAEVAINGRQCGSVWCAPFVVDVTDSLKAGNNQIEIAVTNTWYNRIVGLAEHPDGVPGMTDQPWVAVTSELSPKILERCGLLGPVELRAVALEGRTATAIRG